MWSIDEGATIRATGQAGPSLQFYESWGPNGWMRMNTGAAERATFTEWHFEQFNEEPYQVFGSDPSLGKARKVGEQMVEATRVRLGEEANSQLVIFAEDCSRVTMYKAEGIDRHAPAGQQHYYNDIRVYSKVLPPDNAPRAEIAREFFGGWMLNREESNLTRAPMEAESVVIVPWEGAGWIWNQISGGPYQPEGVMEGVDRVECGAATGAAAIACEGPPRNMMLYWATWDSNPFPTYGTRRSEVALARIDERNLRSEFVDDGVRSMVAIALSADGNRMSVTTTGGGPEDTRIYDRIDAEAWPTVQP
jgi:hypothetical protein